MRKLSHKPGFLDFGDFLRKICVRMRKLSHKPGFLDGWAPQSHSKLGEVSTNTSLVPTPSNSGLIGVVK